MPNLRTSPIIAALTLLSVASWSLAQDAPARWFRVNSDNAFVRCDASATVAYPVGRVPKGTVVEVVEDRFGWARVRPNGDAFASLHAFVPAESGTIAADGRSITITLKTPLKAANFAAKEDPSRSWKEIDRLEPGTTLALVETVTVDGKSFHKVKMPSSSEAWINLAFLAAATPEEVAAATKPATSGGSLEIVTAPTPANTPAGSAASTTPAPSPSTTAVATAANEVVGVEVLEASAAPRQSAAQVARQIARAELADLESIWTNLKNAPDPPVADFNDLRDRYLMLASSSGAGSAARARANMRAEQITLQGEIQARVAELRRLQAQDLIDLEAIRQVRRLIESRSDYVAVGRLNASIVYDGRSLPLLYRVQEPGSGATVGYVIPTSDFTVGELTGQLVGVAGDIQYDESLRLNLITPRRIDVLTDARP